MKFSFSVSEGLNSLILESISSLDEELINLLEISIWDERVIDHLQKKVNYLDLEYLSEIEHLCLFLRSASQGGHASLKSASKLLSTSSTADFRYRFLEEYQDFLCEFIFSSPMVLDFYNLIPDENI